MPQQVKALHSKPIQADQTKFILYWALSIEIFFLIILMFPVDQKETDLQQLVLVLEVTRANP
jgi:hypothetical protein